MTTSTFDSGIPHPARRYNYWLGGKDNFAADRASADAVEQAFPTIRLGARQNRDFSARGVGRLARQGVSQFLDIGTGIPASPNVHEVAQSIIPAARVTYVDNDPIVLAHARALMSSRYDTAAVSYVDADLRYPEAITGSKGLNLDLTQPVALLLVAVLHFLSDSDDPAGIVGQLVDALPDGSWVAASHATDEYMTPEQRADLAQVYPPTYLRAADDFRAIFTHPALHIVDPGVVSVARWGIEGDPDACDADVSINALLAKVQR